MCLDVIGCHAVDTVIFGGGIRPIVLARSLMPACFKQSPARRAWEAPTRWRFAIACSVPACLLPIMPCRSLRSSLVRYCRLVMATMSSPPPPRHGHDVIGRLVIEPIPPRHIITPRCLPPSVPFPFHVPIAPRLACFAPVIRPIARYHHAVPSARLPPHHLGVVISSSRLRVMPSPPLAPPYLSRNGEGLRVGYGLFGCRRLACLVPLPRLCRFGSRPSRPRRLVRFASPHVPTEGACCCGAVASPASPV